MDRAARTAAVFLLAGLGAPAVGAGQAAERGAPGLFPNSSYLDETARHLIAGMRAARDTAAPAIDSYTAVVRERVSVEWAHGRRPVPFVGGEFAWRVRWARSEATIARVLGARARDMFRSADRVDFTWAAEAARYAADPLADPFSFVSLALSGGREGSFDLIRSPLASGAEQYYQYRSGDTITVVLPGGESLRAVQVTAIPRVRSARLAAAMLWIEPESFGLARVAYRLAKRIDSEVAFALRRRGEWRDGLRLDVAAADEERAGAPPDSPLYDGSEDGPIDRLVNSVANRLMPTAAFDVSAVVADYQLRDGSHWLPHSARLEMSAGLAEDALASGEVAPPAPMTIDWAFEVEEVVRAGAEAAELRGAEPPVRTAGEAFAAWAGPTDSIAGDPQTAGVGDVVVILPRRRRALVESGHLPAPVRSGAIGGAGAALMERVTGDLAAIGTGPGGTATAAAAAVAASPWNVDPPFSKLWLMRYNAVEGVSVGARAGRDFGSVRTGLTVRAATRALEPPDARLMVSRGLFGMTAVAQVYRSLRFHGSEPFTTLDLVASSDMRPEDYQWTHGGALQIVPGDGRGRLSLSAFAERQMPVGADFRRFRYGGWVDWRPWRGGVWNESGAGLDVRLAAIGGDGEHVKGTATGAALWSLGAGMRLGVEAGGARVWGDPWWGDLVAVGAAGRLRGHEGLARAASVWHGRAELQKRTRLLGSDRFAFNVGVFADWARADGLDHAAWGVGLALPGGFLRLDLARGIVLARPGLVRPAEYRAHLVVNRFF